MEVEVFETEREFWKRFPSKFYICSNCGYMTNNDTTCEICGWRADGLFKTMNKGYKFTIKEKQLTREIFKPIELKGEKNE